MAIHADTRLVHRYVVRCLLFSVAHLKAYVIQWVQWDYKAVAELVEDQHIKNAIISLGEENKLALDASCKKRLETAADYLERVFPDREAIKNMLSNLVMWERGGVLELLPEEIRTLVSGVID